MEYIQGLPTKFFDELTIQTQSEVGHWKGVEKFCIQAAENEKKFLEKDKWIAWAEIAISSGLPLNNGGPIRRLVDVAIFRAKDSNNQDVYEKLLYAVSPGVYKPNSCGPTIRYIKSMLPKEDDDED